MCSGTITIDGVDISTIPRQDVRSKLVTVPQESFFYHANIRDNLDLNGEFSNDELFEVLQKVWLGEVIQKKGGLSVMMSEDLLSHGQKQLLSFARAILRPNKILILDEATSRYVGSQPSSSTFRPQNTTPSFAQLLMSVLSQQCRQEHRRNDARDHQRKIPRPYRDLHCT